MDISLKEDSIYKEVQNLYASGFSYEQILAIANFIVAIQNCRFTKDDSAIDY